MRFFVRSLDSGLLRMTVRLNVHQRTYTILYVYIYTIYRYLFVCIYTQYLLLFDSQESMYYTHTYIYLYTRIHIYIYIYIYAYIYIYIGYTRPFFVHPPKKPWLGHPCTLGGTNTGKLLRSLWSLGLPARHSQRYRKVPHLLPKHVRWT